MRLPRVKRVKPRDFTPNIPTPTEAYEFHYKGAVCYVERLRGVRGKWWYDYASPTLKVSGTWYATSINRLLSHIIRFAV